MNLRPYAPLLTGAWSPRLYRRDGAPVAFSPFPLLHLRDAGLAEERAESISAIAERFFDATQRVQAHAQRKEALAARIRGERERAAARERSLEAEAERAAEAERWRRWGEAIYAHAWTLQPGQRELVAEGLTVPLDPARTPSENARAYFERYRKALLHKQGEPNAEQGAEMLRALNQRLIESERRLTNDDGLPRRPWYKHLIYAPVFYTGYGAKTLPGVREAIEERHWKEADEQIEIAAKALEQFSKEIEKALALFKEARAAVQ